MPFVERDSAGQIVAVRNSASDYAFEELSVNHPEIQSFLGTIGQSEQFTALDLEFIRVIEDVIDVLIQRNVILYTDLPEPVQAKLNKRRSKRSIKSNLGLLDSGSGVI